MTMTLASTHHESSPLPGMILAAAAFALLTSVDTIFKLMGSGHPAYQILLVNGGFATVPVLGWALLTGGLTRLSTARPVQHLVRGSTSVSSAFAAIYAYSRLPLTDFYAIVFAGPLLVTALSAFWLGEKVGRARWIAVGIGFCGILLVTQPFGNGDAVTGLSTESAMAGRFAALLSIFCYALSTVMIRRMRLGESNITFSFYGYVACTAISGILWLLFKAPPLQKADFIHLALSGFLAGISSICLTTAYHRTQAALIAPFQYTQIIWGAVAGWFIWAQLPGMKLLLGAAIVAASGLFNIYREMRVRETP
jgi:drug/metabolite transporter (DMT)-like permease